jgi:hypothetical protein
MTVELFHGTRALKTTQDARDLLKVIPKKPKNASLIIEKERALGITMDLKMDIPRSTKVKSILFIMKNGEKRSANPILVPNIGTGKVV